MTLWYKGRHRNFWSERDPPNVSRLRRPWTGGKGPLGWIGAGGETRTPTGFRPTDFPASYGFRRPCRDRRVCGLDYPFTLEHFPTG